MGSQSSDMLPVQAYRHPLMGLCHVYRHPTDPHTYLRTRTLSFHSSDDLEVFEFQRQQLSLQKRPYIVCPHNCETQPSDPCTSGLQVLLTEEYYSHSLRKVLSNYRQQRYSFRERELMYVAYCVVDSLVILNSLGLGLQPSANSIYVDIHGHLRMYPTYSLPRQVMFTKSQRSSSQHLTAALMLELVAGEAFNPHINILKERARRVPAGCPLSKLLDMLIGNQSLDKLHSFLSNAERSSSLTIINEVSCYIVSLEDSKNESVYTKSTENM